MTTLQKQISLFTEDQSTSLREDSPANHTAPQENEKEKKMIATSGRKCLERFERLPQSTLWAKTFLGYLVGTGGWYSKRCKLTWKLKGTKYNRSYFQLAASVRPTKEKEYGLLPTPQAIDGKGKGRKLRMKTGNRDPQKLGNWRGDLKDWANQGLLPTPSASDNRDRGGPTNPCVQKRIQNGKQVGLTMMIDGQLNPRFVAEMMGFPENWTELPFLNGYKDQFQDMETQ